jgi:hypothetical protein
MKRMSIIPKKQTLLCIVRGGGIVAINKKTSKVLETLEVWKSQNFWNLTCQVLGWRS